MAGAERSKRRRLVWYGAFVAPAFVALAAVLIAIGRGHAPGRLWPVAGFLMVWALSVTYVSVARRAFRRRIVRLQGAPVPRHVRLAAPIWIELDRVATMLGLFAILGTIVAALGFPGVVVGILLVAGGMLVLAVVVGRFGIGGVRALTFEDGGLRFHLRGAEFLVPWSALGAVDCIGPEHFTVVHLEIVDVESLLRGVSPDTPRNRERIRTEFSVGGTMLQPWTAGLDGQTLARAILEGRDGVREPAN